MARIRTIKPELPQDVKLASISRDARYTFVLLISQADDEGLIPGAHRQLLGLLYPHNDDVTTGQLLGWVEELVGIGSVRWRETVDGAPVIELTNWSKHQRVDNKGRSQLAGFLVPFAETRREPPRTAATRGISPLGSRTKEVGEGEGAVAPPPRIRVVHAPWVLEGVDWWLANVGTTTPAKFSKALAASVARHSWERLFPDLQKWALERVRLDKVPKPDWYTEIASGRLAAKPAVVDEFGCLTEYGERLTRPVSA